GEARPHGRPGPSAWCARTPGWATPTALRRHPADHEVAEHCAGAARRRLREELAMEEVAEGVLVRHLEDAVGADEHVQVERSDVVAEDAVGTTAGHDLLEHEDGELTELLHMVMSHEECNVGGLI